MNVTRASENDIENKMADMNERRILRKNCNSSVGTKKCARNGIYWYHYCQVRMDKSVPRVTVWHHSAEPHNDPWDRFVHPYLTLMSDSYSLISALDYGYKLELPQ